MTHSFASLPRLLFGRKPYPQVPQLVRHDVLVVAAGTLRAVDIALMPLSALLAYLIRFGSLDIDMGHLVVVPFGMVIIANSMALIQAYDHRELCSLHAQCSRVTAG